MSSQAERLAAVQSSTAAWAAAEKKRLTEELAELRALQKARGSVAGDEADALTALTVDEINDFLS